jgi:hypothetical protein
VDAGDDAGSHRRGLTYARPGQWLCDRSGILGDKPSVFTDGTVFVDEFIDGLDGVRPAFRTRFLIPVEIQIHLRFTVDTENLWGHRY